MKVSEIVARVDAECPGFNHVDHALTGNDGFEYPAAFVAPIRTAADYPRVVGMSQMTRQTWGVYIVMPKRSDNGASSAADDLDTLRAQLRAALIRWRPAGSPITTHPLHYAGGELTERDGLVCWREDFAADIDLG